MGILFLPLLCFCLHIACLSLLTDLQELARLSQKFEENVLDATKKFEKLIVDKQEVEGLPATALGMAAQTALSKVFGIDT